MNRQLDTYLITIDEQYSEGEVLGISQIAYVDSPAIQIVGMAYSIDQIKQMFYNDNIKMRIAAPVLVPMTIYRYDEDDNYEYNVQFTSEVIEQIYTKFMKNLSNQNVFNLEHNPENTVPAYVLETMLCDTDAKVKMIKDEYGIDIPKGSVFMVSQVTDRAYYDDLVKNKRFAYSIEGFLGLQYKQQLKNNKNKKEKMEENILKLPTGEHQIGDKIYVVDEMGNIVEVKDVVAPIVEEVVTEDQPIVEEKKEEAIVAEETPVVEEKKEEIVAEETQVVEEKVTMEVDEVAVMAILQPKLDEVYTMIAELKALLATKEDVEVEEEVVAPVAMSANQKFSEVMNFLNKQ